MFPCGVSVSDCGRGDAHKTGACKGRAGEVSAVQRNLQCYEKGKGMFSYFIQHLLHHVQNKTIKGMVQIFEVALPEAHGTSKYECQ